MIIKINRVKFKYWHPSQNINGKNAMFSYVIHYKVKQEINYHKIMSMEDALSDYNMKVTNTKNKLSREKIHQVEFFVLHATYLD